MATISVATLEQAKIEATRQVVEEKRRLSKVTDHLAQAEATAELLPDGEGRHAAVQTRDGLRDELRHIQARIEQKERVVAGLHEQLREARVREEAAHAEIRRKEEAACRRKVADLFDIAAEQLEALGETLDEILNNGQNPRHLDPLVRAIAQGGGGAALWLVNAAKSERRALKGKQ